MSVKNATKTIDSPTFSPDADELLVNNNPERFRQRFGDSFISGVLTGGEYFSIYQVTSSDQKEKEGMSSKINAAFKSPVAAANLGLEINNETEKSKSHLEVICRVFRQGTISTADLNAEDIMKSAKDFPVGVSEDKAFPYEVLLQSYDGLKNPNDQFVYVDIQNQQDVLKDLAKKRFEFLALRDNLKYILKFSDDFTSADDTPVDRDKLIKDYDEVVTAINTMQDEASTCTRDAKKCNFTKFDVAKFNVPILAQRTPESNLSGIWIEGGGRPGVVISVNDKAITIEMSAYNRPFAQGFILNDSTISVTFSDDPITYTGKLELNKIMWSNNTVWIKI